MALLAGCSEFRSPAELRHAQILAVRLEHPQLRAGERARVDVLVTDAEGVVSQARPSEVTFAPDIQGRPLPLPPEAAELIERQGDDFFIRAPDEPTLDRIAEALGLPADSALRVPLRITVALGADLRRADKLATVLRAASGIEPARNPVVQELVLDGRPLDETAPIPVSVGRHELAAAVDDSPTPLSYAWYAAVGEVEGYRGSSAILETRPGAEGAVLLVVRNNRGGVGWRIGRVITGQ